MGKIAKLIQKLLVCLVMMYRRLISPILGQRCRFHPSCSMYAKQALGQYGVIKGGYLTTRRLLRCNPLHPGGFDYVPETNNEAK